MHFPDQKLIFIHVQKTGGNFFSRCFLRYTSENLVTGGMRDGVQRFEMHGPVTAKKHQNLAEYVQKLGAAISDYSVVAIARPPLERLVSFYYSPSRWLSVTPSGDIRLKDAANRAVDAQDFAHLVQKVPSISQMLDHTNLAQPLSLKSPVRHASGAMVSLIAFSDLRSGLASFAKKQGFGTSNFPDRPVNTSVVSGADRCSRALMAQLSQIVAASHHAVDNRIFE